jgi:hypothetical protein
MSHSLWFWSLGDEQMWWEYVNIFDRKILRKIFGAVREGDHWRAWYNNELYGLYREKDLVLYIKVGRMRWAGHVSRMEDSDPAKQAMEQNFMGLEELVGPSWDGWTVWPKMLEIRNY